MPRRRQNFMSSPRSHAVAFVDHALIAFSAIVRRGSGDDEVEVEVDDAAEAAARLAGAERAIEREQVRDRVAHREAARRAVEPGREALAAAAGVGRGRPRPAPSVREGLLERLDEPGARGRRGAEPVLHDGSDRPSRAALGADSSSIGPPAPSARMKPAARSPPASRPRQSGGQRHREGDEARVRRVRGEQPGRRALRRVARDRPAALRQCGTPIFAKRSFRWSCSSVIVPTVERDVFTGRRWSIAIAGRMPSMRSTLRLLHAVEELRA
jgi:hypothetical protein